jgi:hypothetical protein
MNRSCQRHTHVLLLPVRRMISTVPGPAAVNRTIRARHTCLCGLFRSAMIASRHDGKFYTFIKLKRSHEQEVLDLPKVYQPA